jgi:tetratricopeptide (TPR) repeat protein
VAEQADAPEPGRAVDLPEFIGLLGELRAGAGMPSYRVLAKRVGPLMRPPREVSTMTVADAFKAGRRRLDLDLVVAIVRALGVEGPAVDRWRQACVRVHAEAKTGGPVGVFAQLPTDLASFTGRHEELARIVTAATGPRDGDSAGANTVVISSIEGMAGVGKTQLAVHAAHQLVRSGHFTDTQLHVNLRGFDPEHPPADPSAVLEAFLRQLGVPAQQIPAARDERAAMYRDQLRERSALVLLDNAADEDQVRDLIPSSASSLVLITSRRSLAGLDGVTPTLLDTFTEAESLDLLIRIAGRDRVAAEPEAASRIVEFCDHLPLALTLAAARLRSRPAWSLAELADRMDAGRLEAIRAGGRALRPVFALSYRELPEPLQRVFRLLGHHPGPDLTAPMVAVLAELTTQEAESALEALMDENLVRQSAPGRYELHDLLRLLAAELAEAEPEPDPTAPLTRLARWAVTTGYAAAVAIDTRLLEIIAPEAADPRIRFDGYDDALDWLDREQQNLAALQRAAAAAGLHRFAWQIALVQKQHVVVRYRFAGFLGLQQQAVESARECGDRHAQALLLSGLAANHWKLGDIDQAEDCYVAVGRLYHDMGDAAGEGAAMLDRGGIQYTRGDLNGAAELFTQSLELLQGEDARRTRAMALMNRGQTRRELGQPREALADSNAALELFQAVDDRRGQALVLGNLAEFQLHDGHLDAALDLYHQEQEIGRSISDAHLQGQALEGIGDAHAAAGRFDAAGKAWSEALLLFEQIDHPQATVLRRRLDSRVAGDTAGSPHR